MSEPNPWDAPTLPLPGDVVPPPDAPTKKARPKPWVWVTWITGLLANKQLCVWQSWFKAHYMKYDKVAEPNFDLAAWSVEHDALVKARAQSMVEDGRKVTYESQNSFYLHGESAVLSGKPDLISKKQGTSTRVSDGKSGEQNNKDWWQVLVYLFAIPLAWKNPAMQIHGEVFYKDGTYIYIEPEELTAARRAEIVRVIKLVSSDVEPEKTPNWDDCRRCDIAECPVRALEPKPDILTSEF